MRLGLDVSTSVVGWAVVDKANIVAYGHIDLKNKKKYPDIFQKADAVRSELSSVISKYGIVSIGIEAALFRAKKSTAHTLALLTKFNGIISWICFEDFGITPEYIMATSARTKLGIKIARGKKAKQVVVEWAKANLEDYNFRYTRHGNLHVTCGDELDAIVIGLALEKV